MKKILIAFIPLLVSTFITQAQNLDQDCNPIGVPAECQRIADRIHSLEVQIDEFQAELREANSAAKGRLVSNIRDLNSRLDTARADLRRCKLEHGPPRAAVHASELTVNVVGKGILETTNDNAPGPYEVDLDLSVRFSRNRCSFIVTRFPTITTKTAEIGFPLNRRVTVEITQDGSGTGGFHPVSGRMSLTIKLIFKYKTGYADPDDATFHLSTEDSVTRINGTVETGSVLEGDGDIKLVGSGRFLHGFLAGATGKLVITARLSPHP
jgi:hypothetical protein